MADEVVIKNNENSANHTEVKATNTASEIEIRTEPQPATANPNDGKVISITTGTNNNDADKTARANLKKFLLDHGLLTLALLLITLGGTLFLSWFGAKEADKWTEGLRYAPSKQISNQVKSEEAKRLQGDIGKIPNATLEEKARIFNQLKEIENRAKSYISVAKAFYIWNYQSISIATVSSIIAAISLFFLSRQGWDRANRYVVNVFIVSFGIAGVVTLFPALFRQEENISNNTRTYLAYIALDNRVNSYIATQQFIGLKPANTGNSAELESLTNIKNVISSVDNELATLNNIYIGFDASKIPNYRGTFNELNQQR